MKHNNLVSFSALQEIKNSEREEAHYIARIPMMEKLELLEEMVRFQEERSRIGRLTVRMIVKGRALFKALESNAETGGLRALTGAYYRHLEHELREFIRNGTLPEAEAG